MAIAHFHVVESDTLIVVQMKNLHDLAVHQEHDETNGDQAAASAEERLMRALLVQI